MEAVSVFVVAVGVMSVAAGRTFEIMALHLTLAGFCVAMHAG